VRAFDSHFGFSCRSTLISSVPSQVAFSLFILTPPPLSQLSKPSHRIIIDVVRPTVALFAPPAVDILIVNGSFATVLSVSLDGPHPIVTSVQPPPTALIVEASQSSRNIRCGSYCSPSVQAPRCGRGPNGYKALTLALKRQAVCATYPSSPVTLSMPLNLSQAQSLQPSTLQASSSPYAPALLCPQRRQVLSSSSGGSTSHLSLHDFVLYSSSLLITSGHGDPHRRDLRPPDYRQPSFH
jgi:hypothetical protein